MLKSWGLTNFKSIYNADLELAPLTVLTGTNSSGKSSFIQSILLIAQTMQNQFNERPLVLNGNFIDLDKFDDIKTKEETCLSISKPLGIRFEIKCEGNIERAKKLRQNFYDPKVKEAKKIMEKIAEDSDFYEDDLNEDLDEYELMDALDGDKEYILQFDIEYDVLMREYNISKEKNNRNSRKNQFSPIIKKINYKIMDLKNDDIFFINAIENLDVQREFYNDNPKEVSFPLLKISESSSWPLHFVRLSHFWPYKTFWHNIKDGELFIDKFPNDIYIPIESGHTGSFDEFNYFFNNIKYLGPLRYHSTLYPISKASDSKNVGINGENTASVYDIYMEENIKYIPTSNFDNIVIDNYSIESTSLYIALNDWLKYLCVADSIEEPNLTKHGYELTTNGISIFHVGTGVSQVLPVLVSCLISEPNSTLIFEQPELHLHPKVQSRLADFFISMALLGKQCIIETHSEYFIDKLRLRICQSLQNNNENIKNNTKIYYFDKVNQETKIKEIKINEYGDYSEWPDGFFDEHQNNNEEILDVINKKKFNKNNNNSSGMSNE